MYYSTVSFRLTMITLSLLISILSRGQDNRVVHNQIKYHPVNTLDSGVLGFDNQVDYPEFDAGMAWQTTIPLQENVQAVELNLMNAQYVVCTAQLKAKVKSSQPQMAYHLQYSAGKPYITVFVNPFVQRQNTTMALSSFDLFITPLKKGGDKPKAGLLWAEHSVLKEGQWYKVKINKSGIYKVTGSDLAAMGFNLSQTPVSQVRLYGNGGGLMPEANNAFFYDDLQENAIQLVDRNNDGFFDNNDYFLFYGQGPNVWKYDLNQQRFGHSINIYDDYAYYFITLRSGGSPKRIQTLVPVSATPTMVVDDFIDMQYYDKDSLNLIKSGKQWFGKKYDIVTQYNFSFTFPNLVTTKPLTVKASVAARATANSTMVLNANGTSSIITIPAISGNYNSAFAANVKQEFSFTSNSSTINISTQYNKSTSAAVGWLDYLEVQGYRRLTMTGGQMRFRNTNSVGPGNITRFSLDGVVNNIQLWDVTNPLEPQKINYTWNAPNASFTVATDSLRTFCAFEEGAYYSVMTVGPVANQDLHATPPTDYIICYNSLFKTQAEELAAIHRSRDSLKVFLLDQALVFNEFSSGAADIAALRNFMRMLYDRALYYGYQPPRYLLLFGDASYDYKNRIANNTNKVLTFQSATSLSPTSSYSSDDFFGLLDSSEGQANTGSLDIGIGRFPVNTTQEADLAIEKVKRYLGIYHNTGQSSCNTTLQVPALADWRNVLCFIGDDQDNNIHVSQANYLANYVENEYPVYNIDKIYLDAYVQQTTPGGQRYPDAKRDLNQRMAKGCLLINYTGHGGEIGLAHESLLDINDINSWSNADNMPLFITATCEFSRYDDPERVSAGELSFLHQSGGVVALLTTSRLTFSGSNFTLNKVVYQNIFKKTNGQYPALGDVIRHSKVGAGSIYNNRNFVLIGDPALKLAYPKYDVKISTINQQNVNLWNDTIGALDKITITGRVEAGGSPLSSFNGYLYPTLFDKPKTQTTLANDPDSQPYSFSVQDNVLYKGKISIHNGIFSFSFIVPKDINYSLGPGKLSFYATDGTEDANGYFDSLLIGGNSAVPIADTTGPSIRPFMNDTNFINGGLTDENPTFLAFVHDENGINTTGNGIGHDITLTLDGNTAQSLVLNSFYQADIDTYRSGKVLYPLSGLSPGPHQIAVKVWDILNNSATATLDFVVAQSTETIISDVLTYPNPFTDQTRFIFNHNMDCSQMDIDVEIYTLDGKLLRILRAEVSFPGYRVDDQRLKWDGTSKDGQKLSPGIYLYRLVAATDAGRSAVKSGKLVLLK